MTGWWWGLWKVVGIVLKVVVRDGLSLVDHLMVSAEVARIRAY